MLLTLIFLFMLFGIMGKMMGFAFRFSWGLIKVVFYLVFLPFILIAMVFGGLLYIAFPVLIVAMIIGLIFKEA